MKKIEKVSKYFKVIFMAVFLMMFLSHCKEEESSWRQKYMMNPGEAREKVFQSLSVSESKSAEEKIYGVWQFELSLSQDVEEDGVEMEVEVNSKGVTTYHRGGSYTEEGKLSIVYYLKKQTLNGRIYRFNPPKYGVTANFSIRAAGDWKFYQNASELVETTRDSNIIPLNQAAESLLKETEFKEIVRSLNGETRTSRILSISESRIEMEEYIPDFGNIRYQINKIR